MLLVGGGVRSHASFVAGFLFRDTLSLFRSHTFLLHSIDSHNVAQHLVLTRHRPLLQCICLWNWTVPILTIKSLAIASTEDQTSSSGTYYAIPWPYGLFYPRHAIAAPSLTPANENFVTERKKLRPADVGEITTARRKTKRNQKNSFADWSCQDHGFPMGQLQ